jgi:hypothetical protein
MGGKAGVWGGGDGLGQPNTGQERAVLGVRECCGDVSRGERLAVLDSDGGSLKADQSPN